MTNKLEWHESQDWIKLNSVKDDMYVFIDLKNGGSIKELKLKGKSVISENPNFNYSDSFASSILFPLLPPDPCQPLIVMSTSRAFPAEREVLLAMLY